MTRLSAADHVSAIQLRRRQLRGQQRSRLLIALWRTAALTGVLTSLLWMVTLPAWFLQSPEQIEIRGNRWLLPSAIQTLLPLRYPQSLLQLHPQELARSLSSRAPISQTTVIRQLLPPRLIVEVQERPPIALTRCDNCTLWETVAAPVSQPTAVRQQAPSLQQDSTWLIDATGMVAPLKSYGGLQKPQDMPQFQVLGFLQPFQPGQTPKPGTGKPTADSATTGDAPSVTAKNLIMIDPVKKSQWQQIYPVIKRSAVKISLLDWQSKHNLILKTELGTVHLGPYSSRFPEQIQALDQMRELQSYRQAGPIAYIDLSDPKQPLLQLQGSSSSQPLTSP